MHDTLNSQLVNCARKAWTVEAGKVLDWFDRVCIRDWFRMLHWQISALRSDYERVFYAWGPK